MASVDSCAVDKSPAVDYALKDCHVDIKSDEMDETLVAHRDQSTEGGQEVREQHFFGAGLGGTFFRRNASTTPSIAWHDES